jgi:hypothetical protein
MEAKKHVHLFRKAREARVEMTFESVAGSGQQQKGSNSNF